MRAYVGLGGNLGDVRSAFDAAIDRMRSPAIAVLRRARIYRTRPIGPSDQPDYLNSAVEIETSLSPLELLDRLLQIEASLGRVRAERWGPRVIDLDVLLYGDLEVNEERLRIPHRELHRRRFALAPLADLAPDRAVPGTGSSVAQLLAELDDDPAAVVLDTPKS